MERGTAVKRSIIVVITISAALISFVQKEEGFGPRNKQGMYVAYPDPGYGWKLPTICNGHTKKVQKGMLATEEQCREFLKEDLSVAAGEVARCIKTPLTQKQQDALVSFTFNTGAVCRTKIPELLSSGNCVGAARQINESPQHNKDGTIKMYDGKVVMKYTTSNGIPLRGLILRREKERVMFESGCTNK